MGHGGHRLGCMEQKGHRLGCHLGSETPKQAQMGTGHMVDNGSTKLKFGRVGHQTPKLSTNVFQVDWGAPWGPERQKGGALCSKTRPTSQIEQKDIR